MEAKDVEQLIAHLGDEIPVLFIYTTPGCAARIRSQLKMKSDKGPYFDPGSKGKASSYNRISCTYGILYHIVNIIKYIIIWEKRLSWTVKYVTLLFDS